MRFVKTACGLACFLLLASHVWSMSHWNEARGVYDDACYLRQAHLFQKFGLDGLDTDISRDDDHYFTEKFQEMGFPPLTEPNAAPCHNLMPATKKFVIQYPPGTGFVLALFPQGFQVIPVFILSTFALFGFTLLGLSYSRSPSAALLTATFGCVAIYLMINPAKASYSMAPTMVACALAGFLTARWFGADRPPASFVFAGLVGVVIGIAVNFRLPNLFLSSGFFLLLLVSFLSSRRAETALQGALFGAACLVGMAPTLIANTINAGSPFSTTYGSADVMPPDFSFGILWSYLGDMQFVLLVAAATWTILMLRWRHAGTGARRTGLVAAGNLLANAAFFMTHPVITPYYTIPVSMLTLWSLLFAYLIQEAEAVDGVSLTEAAAA